MREHQRIGFLLCGGLLGLACSRERVDEQHRDYPMRLLVTDSVGEPLSGAHAQVNGVKLGETNVEGRLDMRLRGAHGQRQRVHVACPVNYRAVTAPLEVSLFRYTSTVVPELRFRCQREVISVAVVVRSMGAHDVPLFVRGEQRSATDANGVAHLVIEGKVGEKVDLAFDTSSLPDLRPISPALSMTLNETEGVVLAEQEFESRPPPPKVRQKQTGAARQAPKGPVRIR